MAIAGMILAISFPAITAGLDGVRLRAAGQRVGALVNLARGRADRDQLPVEIVIDPEGNRISAFAADGRWERSLELADGVRIAKVLPVAEGTEAESKVRRVVMIPGVPAPRFQVQLETAQGRSLTVGVDPLTGVPQIEEAGR